MVKIEPSGAQYSPALAAYSNRVWLVHISFDGEPYLNTHDGTRWSTWFSDSLNWDVDQGVALAPQGGRLWRIATGKNKSLFTSTSDGGPGWTYRGVRDPWKASHSPALTTLGDTMWIFLRGLDGDLYAGTYNGTWSGLHKVSNGAAKPMDAPTATAHQNKIYVMYRR
ncbi:hypothetical protein DKG71_00450 [Streptomyces sp. NEAU-S7GS2]|nr:hypothetical protein DKG71_00450 [Streptomyces sp. NEAU-S7GS2]